MRIRFLSLAFLLLICSSSFSQGGNSSMTLNGYVKDMQSLFFDKAKDDWTTENLIHNRLNYKWYMSDSFTFTAEMRNRLIWGETVEQTPNYSDFLEMKSGWMDLSWVVSEGNSYVFHTMLDRLYLDYERGNLNVRVGKQRINWGMNLVWNPNDVFNAFSYLDFDYEERPGTDALRLQYYTGSTSSMEFVWEWGDKVDEMAFAGLYRFTRWNYDFQVMGGYVHDDWVLGTGWSGDIGGGGFRGEVTWFQPNEETETNKSQVVGSLSGDYTFKNSLYVHGGFLYNSTGKTGKAGGEFYFFNPDISARNLSPARYSLFGQVSYPIMPILNGDMAAIVNPSDGSIFIGPSLKWSVADDFEMMLMSQLFIGEEETEFGDYGKWFFLRFRYSF